MANYTLRRDGPKQYTLNRTTGIVSVVKEQKVLAVTLTRAVVNVIQNSTDTPPYRLPLNQVTAVTVNQATHGKTRVASVTVLDAFDRELWVSKTVSQTDQTVSISSNQSFSGVLLID